MRLVLFNLGISIRYIIFFPFFEWRRVFLIDAHEAEEGVEVEVGVVCDPRLLERLVDVLLRELVPEGGQAVAQLLGADAAVLVAVEDLEGVHRALLLVDRVGDEVGREAQEVGPGDHPGPRRVGVLGVPTDLSFGGG